MATFAEAAIQFIGQDSALRSKLTEMEKAIGDSAQRMASSMQTAVLWISATIAAGGGILGVLVKQSADAGDALAKMSQRIAISVETLSGYKLAADLAGISVEDFGSALQKGSKNLVEAASGTGAAADAYKALGISVTDGSGKLKTIEAVLLEVADKFHGMEDGAQKTAFAMELFGKSGAALIPLLNAGSAELAAQRKEAELLGATWTGASAKLAEAMNDNLTRVEAALAGFRNAVSTYLFPFFNEILESIIAKIKEWGASGQLKIWALQTGEAIISAFSLAADAVAALAKMVPSLADGFKYVAAQVAEVAADLAEMLSGNLKGVKFLIEALESLPIIGAKMTPALEKAWQAIDVGAQTLDRLGEKSRAAGDALLTSMGQPVAWVDQVVAGTEAASAKIKEWGASAIATASKAIAGISETNQATAKAMTETLTYEVDGVVKYMTVAVTKAGAGVAEVVTSQIGTMVDAAKKAAEDLAKQQEQLAGKRRQAAPEQLDRLKQFAEEKGYDTERVTPEDLKRWQGEMDYEQGQQPNVGQQFLGGMPTSFGALQQGLKDTSQRFNDQKLFGELGSPAEIIAGALGGPAAPAVPGAALAGAALSSPAAGMADATKAHLDATYDIVDQGVGKMEERVSRGVEYVNQALPQAIEEMFVRKLMDQASRQ